jgi:hypothetical protein
VVASIGRRSVEVYSISINLGRHTLRFPMLKSGFRRLCAGPSN